MYIPINTMIKATIICGIIAVTFMIISMTNTRDVFFYDKPTKLTIATKYIKNPAHAIAFVALCDYLGIDLALGLAVMERESHFRQYAYSSKVVNGKRQIIARGYMATHVTTSKFIMTKTPGMEYRGSQSEYDSANNMYNGLVHLRYCIETFGYNKGIEIYNVGEGNYKKRIRNPDYTAYVLTRADMIKEEMQELRKEQERKQVFQPLSIYAWRFK